jgi:hypothetical protein
LPKDIALQKAKMEFINSNNSKEKQLPYFWAGAILTGKVNIIKSGNSLPWKEITIGALLVVCIILFARYFTLKATRRNK